MSHRARQVTIIGDAEVRRYLWVRVGFGVIWGIDATFKCLPGFRGEFLSMIRNSRSC